MPRVSPLLENGGAARSKAASSVADGDLRPSRTPCLTFPTITH